MHGRAVVPVAACVSEAAAEVDVAAVVGSAAEPPVPDEHATARSSPASGSAA